MSWVLVVIVHMGSLRPPIEYKYPMPDWSSCRAAADMAMERSEGETFLIVCAITGGEK